MQQQQARKKLTFEPMTPQKVGNDWQVLIAVTLSEGQDVIDGSNIVFYVNGIVEADVATTDVNGRAQKIINLPQGQQRQFTITAQVQGIAVSATNQVNLPREEVPIIELEVATPQRVGGDWQGLATITVSRNQQPFGGVQVQILVNNQAQGQPLLTNAQGRAQIVLNFPASGGSFNVAAQVVNTLAYVNTVVTIPLLIKKMPHRVEVKADGNLGLYTIHVIVVDENGRGVKSSLRFYSLRGVSNPKTSKAYGDYKDVETDDNGALAFPMQFETKETEVGVIVLGTAIDAKVILDGPRGFKLPSLDPTQPKKSWWKMMKDGWNTGGRQIKEEKDKRRGQK